MDEETSWLAVGLRMIAVLIGAIVLHWGLRRLRLRLPVVLARRLSPSRNLTAAQQSEWVRPITLAVLLLQVALWSGVAHWGSEQLRVLRLIRHDLVALLGMSLRAPLFTLNEKSYSAIDVLVLPLLLAALWIATSALARVTKSWLMQAAGIRRGAHETVAVLAKYVLTLIGAVVILQAWGVDVRSLAILTSVLGLGIGFGLQNLINNFVSGLVISLERPIQPGDFVNVGELTGTVERIGARCTEIQTLDRVSILVPNSRFLESEVVNWSHGDTTCRLHLPVGVAYGSDTARVRAALLEAARSHSQVLSNPRPQVEFRGFGDSSLNFELLVWTHDPRSQYRLKSDLYFRIDANFRRHRIQVPFPQRDLHLRSPQIDRILNAWASRVLGEENLDLPTQAVRDDTPGSELPHPWVEDPAEVWTDGKLEQLVERMRGIDGLAIADRRHLLTTYPRCFVGREAVDWLVRNIGLTREEAVEVGRLLVQKGIVHHVLDEHGFKDRNFFYRFYADEEAVPRAEGIGITHGSKAAGRIETST